MAKYKIIEVSSDTNIGGAGKCVLTLLENLDYDRFEVKVVLPQNSLLREGVQKLGAEVIELDGMADKSLASSDIKKLLKIFKDEKPDLVHTHGSMSARIAARKAGAKVVYTRHSVFEPSKKLSQGIGKIINGAINNYYADSIIAVAEAAKDNLTATGINENKIKVILNGVKGLAEADNAEKAKIRERFGVEEGEKVISIVARLEDIKGHDYFIEAADELLKDNINAKFIIAGTGSYEEHLKNKVKELKREKDIIFTGFINDVDKLMNITDIQVNASYGTEATSLALLEGMSIGIPAVVSDFGGNPGVIKNGINGYVVEKKNSKAIADTLKKLLSDSAGYKKLCDGAKELFQKEFTAKAMTNKTMDLYTETIENRRNKSNA